MCAAPVRSTTKYNLFTFLPKNLFEQFQKKANFYFCEDTLGTKQAGRGKAGEGSEVGEASAPCRSLLTPLSGLFVCVSVLVAIVSLTPLSPKTPIVSVAPLVLVLTVSAIKEAVEDWQRYKMDRRINSYFVDTWRSDGRRAPSSAASHGAASSPGKAPPKQLGPVALGSGFEPVLWSDLMVGDLVFIREGGAFPADILLLQSSTDQGIAHIETANLDGETNLKTKQANPECWRIPVGDGSNANHKAGSTRSSGSTKSPGSDDNGLPSSRSTSKGAKDEIHGLKWPLKLPPLVLESAAPSKKLDGSAWKANMTFLRPPADIDDAAASASSSSSSAAAKRGDIKMALGMSQLLLRGCVLRNTKWVIGLVIFTGVETKLMLNNRKAALKRSHVDRIVDQSLYILFGIEFVLCTLGASLNYAWMDANRHLWFLPPLPKMSRDAGLSWFTYLVLLDILIPISLYVSMELVKAAQAYLINQDIEVSTPLVHPHADRLLRCGAALTFHRVMCSVSVSFVQMYHAETNTPAHARTSNLNEELGQVNYCFSDKTGTLTCNVMNFVACSVEGVEYGMDALRKGGGGKGKGSSSPHNADTESWTMPSLPGLPPPDADFPFRDTSLVRSLLNGGKDRASTLIVDQYLTLLATCHTVLPDFPACEKEHVHNLLGGVCQHPVVYQASSPDEKALVLAAKNQGYYFFHREPAQIPMDRAAAAAEGASSSSGKAGSSGMVINGESMLVNILGHVTAFSMLDVFEFSSERARMSVILRDPRDGLIKLLSKGADTKMYRLLSEESRAKSWASMEKSLHSFSEFGLRTLICGYKVLTPEQYLSWASDYARAKSSIDRREELVAAAQNEIEQGLTMLGSTAIEDRLQDGVPDAISTLSAAGIKIWVLTGDKVETAINIARSCSLITPKMDAAGLLQLVIDDKAGEEAALKATQEQLDVALKKVEQIAGHLPEGESSDSLAIVVSGQALSHIFSVVRDAKGREILYEHLGPAQRQHADVLRDQFLAVCKRCAAVVCCRVSPNQKAEIVSLVKAKLPVITLAIGDGANDVAMIKAAHVGIGISGLEGLQAVMASDYSIAQFRFLVPLLLVHGHWSYERISKLILYSFYKNITIALTSIWFAIFSGWSAQLWYDAYAGSVYNIIFTSLPIMFVATLDRDVGRKNLIRFPALYQSGLKNEAFNVGRLLRIIGEGFGHSLLLFFCCFFIYTGAGDVVSAHGTTHDLWVFSTAMYSFLVVVVNLRIALDTSTFMWFNGVLIVLSILSWFAFVLIYCAVNITPNMFLVAQYLMSNATFWLALVVVPAICIVPEVAWMYAQRMYAPSMKDVVMEMERGYCSTAGVGSDGQNPPSMVLVRVHSAAKDGASAKTNETKGGKPDNLTRKGSGGHTTNGVTHPGHTYTKHGGGSGGGGSSAGVSPRGAAAVSVGVSDIGAAELDSRRPPSRQGLFPQPSVTVSSYVGHVSHAHHPPLGLSRLSLEEHGGIGSGGMHTPLNSKGAQAASDLFSPTASPAPVPSPARGGASTRASPRQSSRDMLASPSGMAHTSESSSNSESIPPPFSSTLTVTHHSPLRQGVNRGSSDRRRSGGLVTRAKDDQ